MKLNIPNVICLYVVGKRRLLLLTLEVLPLWSPMKLKLLGITIDRELKFKSHLTSIIYKKADKKINALARFVKFKLPFHKMEINQQMPPMPDIYIFL